MSKKKGKDKKKQVDFSVDSAGVNASQSGQQVRSATGQVPRASVAGRTSTAVGVASGNMASSEQSLANAIQAARESAKALQEAASAFSQQMNVANEMLASQNVPGLGAGAIGAGAGFGAAGVGAGVAPQYGAFGQPALDPYSHAAAYRALGAAGMPGVPNAPGAATAMQRAGGRLPNGAAAGMANPYYPGIGTNYGAANMPGYGAYQGQMPAGQAVPTYQQGHAQAPVQTPYPGYNAAYGYNTTTGGSYDASVAQGYVNAANSAAAANAAKQAAAAVAAKQAAVVRKSPGANFAINQNPAYAVNEDLLTNLPKFGEPPYPLPSPNEILASVPSLTSLAYGTTAAQMRTAGAGGKASSDEDSASYDTETASTTTNDDGVIFAYVEDAEPINLASSKDKNSDQAGLGTNEYEGAEEIAIPTVYGEEEGFSVEIPSGVEYAEAAYVYPDADVSAEYYGAQGVGAEYAFESYTHDADVYESYDGYYYDEQGNPYYYDENGYPYYYDEYGNAYYYDENVNYPAQMSVGKPKTGLVMGILSIVLAFFPIAGFILGLLSFKRANNYINSGGTMPNAYTARIFGKLGMILSGVLLLLYILMVVLYYLALYPPDIMRAIRLFVIDHTPFSFLL